MALNLSSGGWFDAYSISNTTMFLEHKTLPENFPAFCQLYMQNKNENSQFHYHDCLEIGLCLEGHGTEMICNQLYSFSSNSVTVIPAKCIHDSHIPLNTNHSSSVWKYIFVDPQKIGISFESFDGFLSNSSELCTLFHLMYNELENHKPDYQDAFCTLLSYFLILIKRTIPSFLNTFNIVIPDELNNIIQRIHSSYYEDFSISQLARDHNMSLSKLNRMFKHFFNVPPQIYIHQVRLTVAKHLLKNTDSPIAVIASSVGYNSISAFNRAFKNEFSISPRSMRQNSTNMRL